MIHLLMFYYIYTGIFIYTCKYLWIVFHLIIFFLGGRDSLSSVWRLIRHDWWYCIGGVRGSESTGANLRKKKKTHSNVKYRFCFCLFFFLPFFGV